jgi:hypothetical protein
VLAVITGESERPPDLIQLVPESRLCLHQAITDRTSGSPCRVIRRLGGQS